MIEIQTPNCSNIMGHDGTCFVSLSKSEHKLSFRTFHLYWMEEIYTCRCYVPINWIFAVESDQPGQTFSAIEQTFHVHKNKVTEIQRIDPYNKKLISEIICGVKFFASNKFLFFIPNVYYDVKLLPSIFMKLFNANIPSDLAKNDLIIYNKSTHKTEVFHLDSEIVSIVTNPDESIVAVGCVNKIVFLDI